MVRRASPLEPITLGTDVGSGGGSLSGLVTATGTITGRSLPDRFGQAYNVLDFGADNTGIADAAPAIQATHDAAISVGSNYFEIPPGEYLLNSQCVFQDGITIRGLGRPRMVLKYNDGSGHPNFWSIGSDTRIEGLLFDHDIYTSINLRVIYCRGLGAGRANNISECRFVLNTGIGVYGDNQTRSMEVTKCTFIGGSGATLFVGSTWCRVLDCYAQGVPRAFQFYGGQNNTVSGNVVEGGNTSITGISFLSNRGSGALTNLCFGNVVTGNAIFHTLEEGISFDGVYNTSSAWPESSVRPIVTVSSLTVPSPANAGYIRVVTTETGQSANWANNYTAVPINGNALGQPMFVVGSGNAFIDVERSNGDPPLTAGDKIVITSGFFQNVVSNNALDTCSIHSGGAGEGSIVFWGSCWGNVILGNTIRNSGNHGINVSSQVNTLGASPNFNAQGWAGYNIIQGNTVHLTRAQGGAGDAGYPIKVYTKNYGAGLITAIHTPGVQVLDNIIMSQNPIWISDCNDARVDGNKLLYSSDIIFDACVNCRFGRNYKLNVLMTAPTETGGTTGTIKAEAAAMANIGAAPSQSDFNTLLTNLRAAELQAP
jgi:hypothetical protein